MGFMDRLLGRSKPAASQHASSRPPQGDRQQPPSTRGASNSPQSVRKELVRVCTREMLLHNGIPSDWIRAEPLTTAQAGRDTGVHVRLLVQHWDPRLVHHAVALQEHLHKRIVALDPLAEQWLMGISWQFALGDTSQCPPLPHPGSWTSHSETAHAQSMTVPQAMPVTATPSGGNADVISGPTRIRAAQAGSDARKDLERLLAEGDAAFGAGGADDGFGKTQPMGIDGSPAATFEKTQPLKRV